MEISDPQITTESLMDSIREGARLRLSANGDDESGAPSTANPSAAGDTSAPAADFPRFTQTDTAPLNLQPDFEPRADDQYHVNDLLKYHDRNFIQNAYRAILKRGPDATGYEAFIEAIRSGRLNKVDVLARLRYSAEGRAKKVRVDGLFLPAAVRQLYRLPLIGYLLRLGVGLARLPASVRHQQQFEAHVHSQQQLIVDHTNHLNRLLDQHRREVAHALAQLNDAARAATFNQQQQLDQLKGEQQTLTASQQSLAASQQTFNASQQAMKEALLTRLGAVQSGLQERFDAAQARMLERLDATERQFDLLINKALARWQREMQLLETRHTEQSAHDRERADARAEQLTRGVQAELEALARQLRGEVERAFHEVERVFQKEQEVRAELSLQGQRVARLLEEAGKRLPAPFDEPQLEVFGDEQRHLHDAFYLSLEERFRGSPAEIKERLRVYLPLVRQARVTSTAEPLLDIGCGRGEWLELLREMGVPATGVDSNRALAETARERGLRIVEADLMAYLRDLPDESLGALTGFHIVEHLPLETLLGLLDETVRVVRPGGLVIFETPNPENVLVGSCNFYFDPTHRNPLPAPVMKFLLESRGLNRVEIIQLNPSAAEPVEGDTDLVKRFNQFFYGPMDYAVVGWKS